MKRETAPVMVYPPILKGKKVTGIEYRWQHFRYVGTGMPRGFITKMIWWRILKTKAKIQPENRKIRILRDLSWHTCLVPKAETETQTIYLRTSAPLVAFQVWCPIAAAKEAGLFGHGNDLPGNLRLVHSINMDTVHAVEPSRSKNPVHNA